jgi:hypothetical protein
MIEVIIEHKPKAMMMTVCLKATKHPGENLTLSSRLASHCSGSLKDNIGSRPQKQTAMWMM